MKCGKIKGELHLIKNNKEIKIRTHDEFKNVHT